MQQWNIFNLLGVMAAIGVAAWHGSGDYMVLQQLE